MRISITPDCIKLWLSASDTYNWAHKEGAMWPCSYFENKRVFAEFDSRGLVDLTINGKYPGDNEDSSSTELNAILNDHLKEKVSKDHKLYSVVIQEGS
jgi:hypothetical protein